MYKIENGNVYYEDDKIKRHEGIVSKIETIRIDNSNVQDISYQFDLELGEYVEQSRTTRTEPIVVEKTELELLREENAELRARDSQLQDDNNFIIEALINAGII